MEYDANGLKCLGELGQLGLEEFIRDMVATAEDFVEENIACETIGYALLSSAPTCTSHCSA